MDKFAITDIEHAFRQLEFAVKLMCYCERGHIDVEEFANDIIILLPKENVVFPSENFSTEEEIILSSRMNVGASFGVSAIILDSAFESAGISRNPKSNDLHDQIRTIVFMVRCAFAHNIANPMWEVRGDYNRQFSMEIYDSELTIDAQKLNGKEFSYTHIGGFANWFHIKNKSIEILKST